MIRCSAASAVLIAMLGCDSVAPPPSGLPVTLSYLTTPPAAVFVTGAGDSTVVTVPTQALKLGFCVQRSVDAGISRATRDVRTRHLLVITITDDYGSGVMCAQVLTLPGSPRPTAQVVVHRVPAGTYAVVLLRRDLAADGTMTQYEVASGPVSLP
jgi:hypothetical protein